MIHKDKKQWRSLQRQVPTRSTSMETSFRSHELWQNNVILSLFLVCNAFHLISTITPTFSISFFFSFSVKCTGRPSPLNSFFFSWSFPEELDSKRGRDWTNPRLEYKQKIREEEKKKPFCKCLLRKTKIKKTRSSQIYSSQKRSTYDQTETEESVHDVCN